MRWLSIALFFLVLFLQYPLWFGEGGWLKVWEYSQKLEQLKKENEEAKRRNAVLEAEARDLKTGYAAIEESARSELGMIRPGEVFIPFTGEDEEEAAAASAAESPKQTGGN